ncbi:MFS transporter [Abyssisolibacter fermentans]|uniref:MFS transporter n=1 Tax=Abyssisolibacter fermentans TaxID=1766203 RepID=UPI00082CE6B8|nr:MFS transporter [Abyssisolibacter fermentans]
MKKTNKQWMTLLAICIAGGVIFKIAYLRDVYYVPMKEVFNVTNTELGWMMTAFAVTQFLCYLPGGWLVDVFPVKLLIPLSLITTGALGFYLATYPPFTMVLVIQSLFGVTITLLFWEAMIKGVRMLGTQSEQGRLFGLLEGGRGLFSTVVSFASLFVFSKFGEGKMGLQATIIFYSCVLVLLGILTYFLIEKNEVEGKINAKEALKGLINVAKLPKVWVAGCIIFFGYSFYNGLGYLTPYLTEVYGMSVKMGAALSIVRTYLIAFLAAPIGGMIADKMGSTISYLKVALITGALLTAIYFFVPAGSSVWIVVSVMIVLAAVIMTIRGTYYATTDEMEIPIILAGAAAGILSIVGNTPDLFIFTLYGSFIDKYPGIHGYHLVFAWMIGFAVLGLISCILLTHILKKEKKQTEAKN